MVPTRLNARTVRAIRVFVVLGVMFFASSLMGCGSFEEDLNRMCSIAGDLEKKNLRPGRKQMEFANRVKAKSLSGAGKDALREMTKAAYGDRYQVIKAAANKEGFTDWECPALKKAYELPVEAPK